MQGIKYNHHKMFWENVSGKDIREKCAISESTVHSLHTTGPVLCPHPWVLGHCFTALSTFWENKNHVSLCIQLFIAALQRELAATGNTVRKQASNLALSMWVGEQRQELRKSPCRLSVLPSPVVSPHAFIIILTSPNYLVENSHAVVKLCYLPSN